MKKHLLPIIALFVIATSLCHAQIPILWGMTESAWSSGGTIFNYNTATDTETVVHNFVSDTDGLNPYAQLIRASNGLLFMERHMTVATPE